MAGLNRLGLGLGFAGFASAGPPNAAPTDITWGGSHSVAEDAALGTVIGGALSFTDPDVGDTGTFSMIDDAGGLFELNGSNQVVVAGALDYETATSHNITIRFTDAGGLSYDEVFAITVTDVSEAPVTGVDTVEIINSATPTATVDLGAAHADRITLLLVHIHNGASLGTVTLDGNAATLIVAAFGTIGLYAIATPSGTSGEVVLTPTGGGPVTRATISVLRMVGFSATASDTDNGAVGGTSLTKPIDCPAGGVIVAGAYSDSTTGIDWTNVDELTDFLNDSNQKATSTAARVYASAQTGLNITATDTDATFGSVFLVVASFAPL